MEYALKIYGKGWGRSPVVEYMPSNCEALGSSHSNLPPKKIQKKEQCTELGTQDTKGTINVMFLNFSRIK